MNSRPLRLVPAPLAGVILALSIHAVAQEAAKKVNPYSQAPTSSSAAATNSAAAPDISQPTRARHGMVVTVHHLASDAGLAVLREGGNAVDAAVASAFALAVVHPIAGNLGGGGFLLLREHTGRATFIDFREKAPLAATRDMYLDAEGNVIHEASLVGYRSIATPGSVAGLVYAEQKYGRLSLARVMAPAIRMAAEGFVLSHEEAHELADPDLAAFAESKRIFQRDGDHYKEGDLFRQPELARTLERIAHDPADFYHGKMAHELISELTPGGSLLTLQDLAQYTVVEREPVTGTFHNYTILSAPPPSSGGIVLMSALNILEGYDLASLGDRSPAWIHLITEAFRRAYMDRAEYLGDPDFNHIPLAELTSKQYAAAWRASINSTNITPSVDLVRPAGFLPPAPTTAGHLRESNHTTHLSVVDKDGNAVSLTTTLNDNFGSVQSLQLRNDICNEPTWEAVFTDQEVNAWLAEDLVTHFADQLPPEVHEPRVAVRARSRSSWPFSSARGRPLGHHRRRAAAGPRGEHRRADPREDPGRHLARPGRQRARPDRRVRHGIMASTSSGSRRDGYPVVLIRYTPEPPSRRRPARGAADPTGQLRLAGRSDRTRGAFLRPTLPSRRVLQSKFPRRKIQEHAVVGSRRRLAELDLAHELTALQIRTRTRSSLPDSRRHTSPRSTRADCPRDRPRPSPRIEINPPMIGQCARRQIPPATTGASIAQVGEGHRHPPA